jgi:protein-disulfide isomerase/uncharacterized membrane protein
MMEMAELPAAGPPAFRQPKAWIRWLALALALAGWSVSLQLLLVSAGAKASNPLFQALCGGEEGGDCASVLASPQAYVRISPDADAAKVPVSAFGMGYFAFVALWYLFVGPPTHARRAWHLPLALVVLFGAWQSVAYIGIMKYALGRWCGGCLAAHALNGGILVLTLAAYPWRRPATPVAPHPTTRLALAVLAAGGIALVAHVVVGYTGMVRGALNERTKAYVAILNDPEFILWDFNRQPVAAIPLYDDEAFAGAPTAPNTVVIFSDFQCAACRRAHETFVNVAEKYPAAARFVFRYYPQDPECNPNPRFRGSDHGSACRAARAAEAARRVGGGEAYLAMRQKLWEDQDALPRRGYALQSESERQLFETWAGEIGLGRAAFAQALDAPETAARVQADIELANRLGVQAVPAVYVNGKRLRTWSRMETWDAILGGVNESTSTPTTSFRASPP